MAASVGHLGIAAAGVALLVYCGADLDFVTGQSGSPRLAMTVSGCESHQSGKNRVTDCYGSGDAHGGAVGPVWNIREVARPYRIGAVVPVRCHDGGECEETGTGPVAADLGGLAFGLGMLSAAVLGGFNLFAQARPAPRFAPLGTRRRRRAVTGWFGAVGALAVLFFVVSLAA
ncbi:MULTISPECIES: hypothetical protein [Kitasatospora]|uniref:Uncharacterized protein n=2 Tax=Kitasatospora TaxID=2063 RepID=A0ABT1IQD7_9ACTN|nr:hypothetical protein [Kitasatospora paracochleata]MCP2307341.1 hypothetical protein [Kitasatospora paracochleata]